MMATTVKQSKRLLELGMGIETADMWWTEIQPLKTISWNETIPNGECYYTLSITKEEHLGMASYKDIPAWSLSALLELMPSVITKDDKKMFLRLEKAGAYNLYYFSPNRQGEIWFTEEEPIDASVGMIEWLCKNGYISKEE